MLFRRKLERPDPLSRGGMGAEASCRYKREESIVVGFSSGRPITIPVGRLSQNAVLTGSPGMGKTTEVVSMVAQLAERGIGVTVLEPAKAEYGARIAGSVEYGHAGTPGVRAYSTNCFMPDDGVRVGTWIEDLTCAIADGYGAAQDASGPLYLESLVRRLYRVNDISPESVARGGERWPTIKTYLEQVGDFVERETCSGTEVKSNIRGFLVRRGRSMAACPALICNRGTTAKDLMSIGGVSVLRLCDYGRNQARFLGMVQQLRTIDVARTLGSRPLFHVVVLEEAHSLFVDTLSGEPTAFSRLYESALAELRASGIGFITVEQRPSLLPAGVLANSVTKIAFASSHGDDRDAIERAMGLDGQQARRFGTLGVGEALFATVGSNGACAIETMEGR